MNQQELCESLSIKHKNFIEYQLSLSSQEFIASKNEKWTAGQQLEHIVISVSAVNQALLLPNFLLKLIFGKANRKSRTYDELVQKYLSKLQAGGRASGRFVPKSVTLDKKDKLTKKLMSEVEKMNRKISKLSENELETLIMPHPLLGKLTLREMFYFTIYHVQHHHEITIRNLNG